MKYTLEITIHQPREKVIALFMDPANRKYWQKGLMTMETYKGAPGEEGARSKIKFMDGKGVIELTETIKKVNPPQEIHYSYNSGNVANQQWNYFQEKDGATVWVSETEFTFSGLMRFMAFLTGQGPFKRQSQQYMDDFRAFAEGNPRYGT